EKEQFVLDHWTADGHTKLVLAKSALGHATSILKEVRCIEDIVAEKFPSRTVEAIRTRFDRCVQNRRARAAKFRAEVRRLNLEFLNCIDRRQHHEVGAVK